MSGNGRGRGPKLAIGDLVTLKVWTTFGHKPTGRVTAIMEDHIFIEKNEGGECEAMRWEVRRHRNQNPG